MNVNCRSSESLPLIPIRVDQRPSVILFIYLLKMDRPSASTHALFKAMRARLSRKEVRKYGCVSSNISLQPAT